MGMGGGEQTSTQTSSYPDWAKPYATDLANLSTGVTNRAYEPYPYQRIADTNADTLTGYNAIRSMSGVGQPEMQDIGGVARQVAAYQAPMTSKPVIGNLPTISAPEIGNLPTVSAHSLASVDLSPYLNPWTKDVVNNSTNEVMRAGNMANTQARVGSAGAYASGSARAALLEAENNRNALDRAGAVAGNLNMQGFTNAQQVAGQDAGRSLQADLANQGMAWNKASQNASMDMQGQLANQSSAWQRASQNASMDLQSQLANQNAIAQAQGIRLQGAGMLGDSIDRARKFGYEDASRFGQIGAAQEAKDQKALDLAFNDYLRQFSYPTDQLNLGINALSKLTGGQGTTTTTGPAKDNSGQLISSGIGAAATVAAAFM